MPKSEDKEHGVRNLDGPRRFHALLDDLARREGELERAVHDVLDDDQRETRELLRLQSARSSVAGRRLALLTRWVSLLDQRLSDTRTRSEWLAGQVSKHDESLRMVCHILKEIDDPYGFGLSLDERIAGEGADLASDQTEW